MNDEPDKRVPTKRARQGREGFPVLMVLVGGLVLVMLVWVVVEVYGIFIDEQQPLETPQSSDIPLEEGGAPSTGEGAEQ